MSSAVNSFQPSSILRVSSAPESPVVKMQKISICRITRYLSKTTCYQYTTLDIHFQKKLSTVYIFKLRIGNRHPETSVGKDRQLSNLFKKPYFMKTRHLFCLLLLSAGMIYTSCTRDQVISADQPISEAEAIQWKPADGIARFIPKITT